MTPLQFAGLWLATSSCRFPAAITIARVTPCASTALNTDCWAASQTLTLESPRLRLITCAGVLFGGTPGTERPAAHATPSRMSENVPPHLPSTRIGRIFADQSMPAVQALSLPLAPITAETAVPCQLLSSTEQSWPRSGPSMSAWVTQSPGSDASGSRPLPSLASKGVDMKSYP